MPITPTQNQSDPWGWNAWAQTQSDGSLYGWQNMGSIGREDLAALKPTLQAAGLWKSEYDNVSTAMVPETDGGGGGYAGNIDLSAIYNAGYGVGNARSSNGTTLTGYIGPDGKPIMGADGNVLNGRTTNSNNSMNFTDYATFFAPAVAGAAWAGAGLGAAEGGAAVGAGTGTETLGATAFPVSSGGTVTSTALGAEEAAAAAGTGALDFASMNAGGGLSSVAGTTGSSAATTGSGFGSLFSGAGDMSLGQWAQLASSVYGLYQGNQMMNMGQNADPFGPYRGQYAAQLNTLMQNPSSVTSLPGYKAGLDQAEQSLTRNSASQGLTGSGTTAAALANLGATYQGNYFNTYLSQLAGLAGAGSTGAGGSMAGYAAGANTQNQSLQNLIKLWGATSTSGG